MSAAICEDGTVVEEWLRRWANDALRSWAEGDDRDLLRGLTCSSCSRALGLALAIEATITIDSARRWAQRCPGRWSDEWEMAEELSRLLWATGHERRVTWTDLP